jgi:D-ala-D-ala dipeptidase
MNDDFVFVDEFVRGLRWDAKYATWDNFTGKPVDGHVANRIVGTRALCATLDPSPHRRGREQWASQHGLHTIVVRSNVVRSASHPFYEAIGYQRTATSHLYRKQV